jgi:V/A-type H+-transporting ATPase subunit E
MNNLNELTDKIYNEGIERAQQDSRKIIAEAETNRDLLLKKANAEAKTILANAEREAARISRSVDKELQLKGKQLVHDIKIEIHNLLSKKILDKNINDAMADVPFFQSAILEAIASWQPTNDLEIVLPLQLENKLDDAFIKSISEHSKNMTLTFSNRLTGGFRIVKQSEGYQISFSDEDFVALFNPYLTKKVNSILFNETS